MNIALAYIAVANGKVTDDLAARFATTYHDFPGGEDHTITVVCNGGPLPRKTGLLFSRINCSFYPRPNTPGWDIDGYLDFAKLTDADMLVCLGESVYFHRSGWLTRLANAWAKHGPGMYSPFASHTIRAHLNTTAFVCPPKALLDYPMKPIKNRQGRYDFEHGQGAFWRWMNGQRYPTMLVTWDGEWMPGQWRLPPNVLFRGDQSNCLMRCTHTDYYERAPEPRKQNWSASADRPFK